MRTSGKFGLITLFLPIVACIFVHVFMSQKHCLFHDMAGFVGQSLYTTLGVDGAVHMHG